MNTDTETKPASSEQAADLAALQAAAASEQQAAAPSAQADQAQAIQPPSAQAMALAGMLVGMLKPIACYAVPSLKKAPAELWMPIPEGVAAVLDHYNLSESELLRNPWARLAMACAPLAAFAAMNAEPEKKDQADDKQPPLAAPVPTEPAGSKTVQIGAPIPEGAAA